MFSSCAVLSSSDYSRTKAGWTALHFAAYRGHPSLARALVSKHNASIDATTMKKQTPLHLAAMAGKIEVGEMIQFIKLHATAFFRRPADSCWIWGQVWTPPMIPDLSASTWGPRQTNQRSSLSSLRQGRR